MVKPEWGTKRTCPKCWTRFYDLGKEDPVHCIECGTDWVPEPVLKSKQPLAFEAAPTAKKEPAQDDELAADDLAIDEDGKSAPTKKSISKPATTIWASKPARRGRRTATNRRERRAIFPLFQPGEVRLRRDKDVGP